MRAALEVLARQRGPVPALQLAGGAHPELRPAAVLQPDRSQRLNLEAPDWDGQQTFPEVHVLATPSREETREYLALARRAGGRVFLCAENRLGADGWRKQLKPIDSFSQNHCRLMELARDTLPDQGDPLALRPPYLEADFVSCPGLFSWDRFDPGSQLLLDFLPAQLPGDGADLGCGPGLLARQLLKRGCRHLDLVDVDQRAVRAAWANCAHDERCRPLWLDLVKEKPPGGYDWLTLNPPFHGSGQEDRALGLALLARAAGALRRSGTLWMVANEHLPYQEALGPLNLQLIEVRQQRGYKLFQCRKNA
ncbi:MAG: methyltransferase [Candidatus Eremiobacteraeota bacterium]|nr:methyltransferase [Candidatus Eremiobacteraeota bacterium]MCW5866387.1 methyltransferase [Candidatus Eremiobacteraeota bacterium]